MLSGAGGPPSAGASCRAHPLPPVTASTPIQCGAPRALSPPPPCVPRRPGASLICHIGEVCGGCAFQCAAPLLGSRQLGVRIMSGHGYLCGGVGVLEVVVSGAVSRSGI